MSTRSGDTSEVHSSRSTAGRRTVILVAVTGTALSLLAFAMARSHERAAIVSAFEEEADAFVHSVGKALEHQRWALEALKAFRLADPELTAERFAVFARPILRDHPHIRMLAWLPAVPRAERARFIEQIRSGNLPDFDILQEGPDGGFVPAAPRDLHVPVLHREPPAADRPLGFDHTSDPDRRAVLELALEARSDRMTPPLPVDPEGRDRCGIISYLPVFRDTEAASSTASHELVGFVAGLFSVRDLVTRALEQLAPSELAVSVEDGPDGSDALPIVQLTGFPPRLAGTSIEQARTSSAGDLLSRTNRMELKGRPWVIRCRAPEGYVAARRAWSPWILLVFGLLLTGAVSALMRGRRRSAHRLQGARQELQRHRRDREAAEDALRSSEARFRAVIQDMPVMLIAFGDGPSILAWNDECERVTGYSSRDVIGKPDAVSRLFSDLPSAGACIAALTGPVDPFRDREWELRARDGTTRTVVWSNISRSFPAPGWKSWVVGTDVTDRRRAQKEREELQMKLLHAQKLESLGVMAGGIAHDFNNILTGVLGNAGLAIGELSLGHPSRKFLERTMDAASRAADLTRQLLAYAGRGSVEMTTFDLSQHVRELTALLQTAIPKKVSLRLDLAKDLPPVEADPAQIQQLVMNLVINGAEACGDSQGVVTIATGSIEIDEDYARALATDEQLPAGRYVFLEVQDNGCGMDEQTKRRIFDPFFTTKFTGRGLGLSAVLGIVRAHQGSLKVYSAPGRGSAFKVLLPASRRELAPVPAPLSADLRGHGVILVVDDEPMVLEVVQRILGSFGYEVLTATNGREGVEVYRQRHDHIDLVLLDMMMPEMNGEEAFRAMRGIRPDVRAILSSGFNELEATHQFVGRGLAGFIQKPYAPRALAAKIKEVVERVRG